MQTPLARDTHGHLLNEKRRSAKSYNRRQTVRLNNTTTIAITNTLAANNGYFSSLVARLI